MSEQIGNAMKIAMNAFEAGNAEECINFCNQVLMEDSSFENAKVLKGAAVLKEYSYENAANLAEEAFGIWKTISDISLITDSYKEAALKAIYEFRNTWEDGNTKFYKTTKGESDDKVRNEIIKVYNLTKDVIKSFMEDIARISWLQNYPPFLGDTLVFVKRQIASLERVTYAKILIEANKDKDGKLGELAKQLEDVFKKLKIRRWIKVGIILTIVLVVVIFLIIKIKQFI